MFYFILLTIINIVTVLYKIYHLTFLTITAIALAIYPDPHPMSRAVMPGWRTSTNKLSTVACCWGVEIVALEPIDMGLFIYGVL